MYKRLNDLFSIIHYLLVCVNKNLFFKYIIIINEFRAKTF